MILLLLVPSALYLIATLRLDTHSLLRRRTLFMALLMGLLSALAAIALLELLQPVDRQYAGWGNPAMEELLKLVPLLILARRKRIAYYGDALIYGTAVGVGFALVENLLYMHVADLYAGQIIFRSLTTSLLHAGCTAMAALAMCDMFRLRARHGHLVWWSLPLYLVPIAFHEVYNNFTLLPPNLKFLLLFVLMAAFVLAESVRNDRLIQRWLDETVNSNIQLLAAMREGHFFDTRQGLLLLQQRENYSAEDFFDICCYVQLTIELMVIASSRQLLYESGFRQPPDPQQQSRTMALLAEHDALRRRISPAALSALRPIAYLHHSHRWVLQH